MELKTVKIDETNKKEENISVSIDNFISNLKKADLRKPSHNNLMNFFELVQNAVRSRENSDGVPEDKRILILAEDPPESIDTEAITFYLEKRGPGQFNRGSIGESRIKELTSHVRSIQQHPEHIGEKLVTASRFYDNYISFNIYARDDMTALKRMLWFENVMDSFRWYFRVHGINQVLEVGVDSRKRVTIGELELTKYPMSYFVRTEDIYQFGSQELKHVELNFGM